MYNYFCQIFHDISLYSCPPSCEIVSKSDAAGGILLQLQFQLQLTLKAATQASQVCYTL